MTPPLPGGRSRAPGAFLLVIALLVAACGGTGGDAGAPRTELRVAAAASLRTAIANLADAYATAHPGITFTIATDSSAALRTQVEQGAPFDLFLSADVVNAQALADEALTAGSPVPFTANTVALVVPSNDPAAISTPKDLARPGIRLVAAGANVPITTYADQVIANLAAIAGYPAGYAAAVAANAVSREDNVAAVLAKIELGEGDAGFVYATDAAAAGDVRAIPIPAAANVRAAYAGVVVGASHHADEASAFLAWVAGPAGRAILEPLGFLAP